MTASAEPNRSVALVSLGCARNDVDSEELAAALCHAGWTLVDDPADAEIALVNTCGFIEAAKKDSIDAILEAADLKNDGTTRRVVAVGCLAQRYGRELAEELPEADAVLGFDAYPDLAMHLEAVLRGERVPSHEPTDRRHMLPITPVDRPARAATVSVPGHGQTPVPHDEAESSAPGPRNAPTGPDAARAVAGTRAPAPPPGLDGPPYRALRRRLDTRPWAPLKIASGCDRRCTFCAIPSFRGSLVSRPPEDIVAEAAWLVAQGVREVLLVSENSTSYGKDLGDLRALEALLGKLAQVNGLDRIRVSYLQPAELRPALVEAMCTIPNVMPYFDLSFQHASPPVLGRMRRFGSSESFLALLASIRDRAPEAGVRSNVIVGFPGETEQDLVELESFLVAARLDVVGVFGYSPEDGTEAATLPGLLDPLEIAERRQRVAALVEELTARRAQERLGERVEVLVEELEPFSDVNDLPDEYADRFAGEPAVRVLGRAAFQGPDVDGACELVGLAGRIATAGGVVPAVGSRAIGTVVATDGVDLLVEPS